MTAEAKGSPCRICGHGHMAHREEADAPRCLVCDDLGRRAGFHPELMCSGFQAGGEATRLPKGNVRPPGLGWVPADAAVGSWWADPAGNAWEVQPDGTLLHAFAGLTEVAEPGEPVERDAFRSWACRVEMKADAEVARELRPTQPPGDA